MRARIATIFILLAAFAAVLALNLPGQLSYDSVAQLFEGHTGHYNTWHPPVMAWLMGMFEAVVPGASLFVIFQGALLFGALVLLAWRAQRVSWWAALAAFLCALTPQFFLYQGTVWKDVLFANAGVAGFILLAQACRDWRNRRGRLVLIVLAFALFTLAAMTRQNGAVVLLFGAVALGLAAWKFQGGKAGALYGAVAFFAGLALAIGFNLVLAARGDGGDGARAELAMLQDYDLIGMLHADPQLRLDKIHAADPALEKAMRGDGVRLYSPVRNDTLASSTALTEALGAAPGGLIFAQWRALVLKHPFSYLAMRAPLFGWVFFTPDIALCRPVYTGIDGAPAQLKSLGLAARITPQGRALSDYAKHFDGTPVFSHPAFALVGLAMLYLLLRRRRTGDGAMAFLLLAAFGFSASFFVGSVACDYRYLYFLDLSVLAALFYLAIDGGFDGRIVTSRLLPAWRRIFPAK